MSRIPFILDPGKKIAKRIEKKFKKLKHLFPAILLDKTGRDRRKKTEKKNFVPNSIHHRPGEGNSEKNSKKIQKIKKVNSGIIPIQNGLKEAEKEKKNFYSVRIRPGQQIQKT